MLTEVKINGVFSENVLNNQITSKYIVDELGENRIVVHSNLLHEFVWGGCDPLKDRNKNYYCRRKIYN